MLSLNEIYTNSIEDEKKYLSRIADSLEEDGQYKYDVYALWDCNKTFALAAFFLEQDVVKAKQHFYVCGLIDAYRMGKYQERILDSGIANVSYTILCDAEPLIRRYAHFSHPAYNWMVEHGHSALMYAIQQIMIEDWEKLEYAVHLLNTKNKTMNSKIPHDKSFFDGMLKKDGEQMNDAIVRLLKDHKKRNKHMGIAQEYISIPALTYTKLAWRQGFELDIEHPLIPKALLPVQPLAEYKIPYKFLQDWFNEHPL